MSAKHELDFAGCGRASGPAPVRAALLGKKPRYAPERAFDTVQVSLDLRVDPRARTLEGSCETTVRALRDGVRAASFDAVGLKVSSCSVDGKPARHVLKSGSLQVSLPKALDAGESSRVVVRYRVVRPKTGVHFVREPLQAWSQSQPEDARAWFPCHDNPHEKAPSEVRCAVPAGFTAVSNGALVETSKDGAWSVFHWKMDQPHSIYLISIAVGRFSEIREEWDGIPVSYYCEKGREEEARRGFGKTPKALAFFSEVTGVRYPYSKYAQVAVAEYPGGMEHTTCTTQTDACLIDARAALDTDLDLLVAHELAHQWFGDLVTCRDWSHAWLNEGFATYFEVLFQEHDKGRDEADYEMHLNARSYFDEDSRRYRRPIVCATFKEPWTIFDRHLYEKGAWVLHMLRRELGEKPWRRAIAHYLAKHRDASVETSDLVVAIEEATGRNLRWFFDQWVFKGGYPSVRAHCAWDPKAKKVVLHVQQPDAGDDGAFRFQLDIELVGRGWRRRVTEEVCEKEHVFRLSAPSAPLDVEFDPEHRVLWRLALSKPRAMWLHQLERSKTGIGRLLAAGPVAAWGGPRAVAALARAAARDPFWGAAAEAARALGGVSGEAAFDALKKLAGHRHPKVRRAVAETLGRFRRPDAARALLPLTRDPSIHVESAASYALGSLAAPGAEALLKRKVETPSYRQVVSANAVAGLAALREPRHLAALRRAAKPPYGFGTRASALRALGDFVAVDGRALDWLCEALDDSDERLSLVALGVLGHIEDPRAVPALEKAAKSANTRIRVHAEEALARTRHK